MPQLRPLTSLLLGILLVSASGCTTTSNSSSEESYQAPPPGPGVAYIKGMNISEGGLFGTDHRGFVFMIDLLPVVDAPAQWNESLALRPGHHTISAEYRYSNFTSRAHLPLEAVAGVTYQLMIQDGHEDGPDARLFCEFWIVEVGSGKRVTKTYHHQVTGGKKGTIFNVNK